MRRVLSLAAVAALLSIIPTPAGAAIINYQAFLSGANEVVPTGSPGTGVAWVIVDDIADTMRVMVTFSGLTANNTAAHIHCCTTTPLTGAAGVATTTPTFTGFPGGTTSGTYDHLFNMADPGSYNAAFITAQGGLAQANAALFAGLASGRTYLNIHTSNFPGGEIRGFLTVPEPVSLSLLGLGLAGVALRRRRRI